MTARTKHNKRPETMFELELMRSASICKCAYFKIPDPIISKKKLAEFKDKNIMMVEHRRPFDGILVTPNGNLCVECKYGDNTLIKHQKENLSLINTINGTGIVLRKKEKFDSTGYRRVSIAYTVEKDKEVLFTVENTIALINWLKDMLIKDGGE